MGIISSCLSALGRPPEVLIKHRGLRSNGGELPVPYLCDKKYFRCCSQRTGTWVDLGGAAMYVPGPGRGQLNLSHGEPRPPSQQHIIETSSRNYKTSPAAIAIPHARSLRTSEFSPRPIASPSAAQPDRTSDNKPHFVPDCRQPRLAPSPAPQRERPSCDAYDGHERH